MTMTWEHCNKTAIVGVGATDYYPRGQSLPRTMYDLVGEAIMNACNDAGLNAKQIDGFAYYSSAMAGYTEAMDSADIMEMLGIPEIGFTATLTSGGGGSAGSVGLASAAIIAGDANYVVTVMALQQNKGRLGTVFGDKPSDPINSFIQPSGLVGPGYLMSVVARRHMHLYGTRREAFAEVVMSQRANAVNRPTAVRRKPLTLDEYFSAPMLADPLCRLDFCLETDGAVAVITTSAERAKDLKQKPVYVRAAHHGGCLEWGRAYTGMQMSDDYFATAGNKIIAERLYAKAGLGPKDIDVAQIYDHFSPMVLMQLEDYGFCERGEGGPFVESGALRYKTGSLPVNTHGGQLSEAYIIGMTHVREAVEQLRGTAVNQVENAKIALVTGGPATLPVSGLILQGE